MNISANVSESHTLEGQSTAAHIAKFADCASENNESSTNPTDTLLKGLIRNGLIEDLRVFDIVCILY